MVAIVPSIDCVLQAPSSGSTRCGRSRESGSIVGWSFDSVGHRNGHCKPFMTLGLCQVPGDRRHLGQGGSPTQVAQNDQPIANYFGFGVTKVHL